ncbi:transcription repressor OFP8 [Cornus florida]|uniref:transcription repressor OFP8 n=1 Tax=Cornus florida TaxID=4283 RepID=UPI00289F6691|nr:transcription repressor OFP8 [Cornus florida]
MENRFKQRVSRLFRSSFGSCRSRNISDVMDRPVFVSQNPPHSQLGELFSPKPTRPFPSICRNKCSQTVKSVENSCIVAKELFPRSKVSDRKSLLFPADVDGRKCPPVSPISPLHTFYDFKSFESSNPKEKRSRDAKNKKKKKTHVRSKKGDKVQFDALVADNYSRWFSSDGDEEEDDDETTLFSSKSLSSDSSVNSFCRKKPSRRPKPSANRQRRSQRKESETGVVTLQGKVKDSLAVVKRSSDPYNDFRTSMVEMIVERQIFSTKDLENLLQCFLSLNSYHHHRVILEVFTEVWEALFSDWS